MTRVVLVLLFVRSLVLADGKQSSDYRTETEKWRHDREIRLKAEDGWLSLVGLFWLKEGDNRIGSDPSAEVILPRGPARVAVLSMHSGKARITVAPGAPVTVNGNPVQSIAVQSDAGSAKPDVIGIGNLKLLIIHRGRKDAIRLKDPDSRTRREFTSLKWFPFSPGWRIEAKFVPYDKPRRIILETMVDEKEEELSPGYAEFQRDGQQIRLQAITEDNELFFIFRDKTAGKTTYPAARFLYSPLPKDGKVILDFNRAYNPPCVFTAYATCPLPVPQNRLSIAIPAGEMMFHSKQHP